MDNPFEQFLGSTNTPQQSVQSNPLDVALTNENISGPQADFIRSIYQQESGSGKNTKTSNAGAVGGMQIIPSTFNSVADKGWDINDPVQNAQAGARYAMKMWEASGGDPKIAAAGYYGGPGAIRKAQQGVAVNDPRNPNAPSTLQYGEQVSSRMKNATGGNGVTNANTNKNVNDNENPFQQFLGDSKGTKSTGKDETNPFEQFLGETPTKSPPQNKSEEKSTPREDGFLMSSLKNTAAAVDFLASTPGMMAQPIAAATGRWLAIAEGAQGKDISQFGHQYGQFIAEKMSSPVTKILDSMGVQFDYSESGVNKALGKVSDVINKGADYLYEHSNGWLTKEDAQDLTNAATLLVAPAAIRTTSKALMAVGGKVNFLGDAADKDTAQVRPDNAPAQPFPNESPETLAKRHIEETTGITRSKENTKEYRQQREQEVRAAYSDDSEWQRYLNQYANHEATSQDNPNYVKAQEIEQEKVIDQAKNPTEIKPEEPISWKDTESILKTPVNERTPEQINKLKSFNQQGGKVDPEMLAKMAAMGIGITVGVNLDPDNKIEGALLGAFGGYAAVKGSMKIPDVGRFIVDSFKNKRIFKPDERIRITDPMIDHQTSILKSARAIWQVQGRIKENAPDQISRERITSWLQGDKTIPLTDKEYIAAKQARDFYESMGKAGLQSGAITNLLDDYVNQQWDLEGINKDAWKKISSGMSTKNSHNLRRKISSIAEGEKLGLKPVTKDVAVLMGMYGNSLTRTMANIKFIDQVKAMKDPQTGIPLITSVEGAPKNYVPIDRPNTMVHPDIKPSMDFLFKTRNPNMFIDGMRAVTATVKRMEVMNPVFHIKNLADVAIGAGVNPLRVLRMAWGKDALFKEMREGGAGDTLDRAYDGGVMITLEGHDLVDEDVNGGFYKSMTTVQKVLDDMIPGGGKLTQEFVKLNKFSDIVLWERVHPGGKLLIFSKAYDQIKTNNERAHNSNPDKYPLKSERELTGIAGRYTNTLYGGMNWMRAAEEVKNRFLRNLALKAYAPSGRVIMQDLFFAPDWKISTTQAFVDAFGKGTGLRGLIKPQELADLHRLFMIRNAIYYTIVGNAINYALTGHSMFENKDKTQLELGDGRTMQFSKHMMDPIHLLQKPGQEILSSLGVLPSEVVEQAIGRQYLSTKGAPPMDTSISGRLTHATKRFSPIGSQGRDAESNVMGNLGFPIAGRTEEQKIEDKKVQREAYKEKHKRKRFKERSS